MRDVGLDRSGISYVNRMVPTSVAPACVFFLAAWRLDIARAWVYFTLFVAVTLSSIVFLLMCRMDLLNQRGKTQADIHKPDRLIMPLYLLFTHVIAPAAAGIELGRLQGGYGNTVLLVSGIAFLAASGIIEIWAMAVNDFYERSIRLQEDRGQKVVARGPYAVVRHPGYVSYILRILAFPLVLGSLYSILPILVGVALMVIRTKTEDALLVENLTGYREYSKKVRYRLFPPIW